MYNTENYIQYPMINHNGNEYFLKYTFTYTYIYMLEKAVATHSSVLAWRIPWTGAWWAVVHGVAKSQIQLSH